MSTSTVKFTISNPAISFLLHDCVKSPHNQIGFLFGEIHKEVSDVTSDTQSNNECVEITVSITATLPVEDVFFSKDGTLNEDILDTVLGEYKKDVVGWYSYSRNLDLSPSIYQLFLAHQLCDYFSHVPRHLFLFFRVTTNVVFDENFTYTNKFVCTTGSDISTPVELHIRQLGESINTYNGHKPVTLQCKMFDTVLNTMQWKTDDIVASYENLQSFLSAQLLKQIDQHSVTLTNQSHQTNRLAQIDERGGGDHDLEEFRMRTSPPEPPDCEPREEKMDQSIESPCKMDQSCDSPGSDTVPPSPPQTGRLLNQAPSSALRSATLNPRNQSPLRNQSPARPAKNGVTLRASKLGPVGSPDLSTTGTRSSNLSVAPQRGGARAAKQNQPGVHQAKPSANGTLGKKTTQGSKPVRILPRDMPLDTAYGATRRDSVDELLHDSQTSNSSENEVDKSHSSYQSQEY